MNEEVPALSRLESAISIAVKAHAGQQDKAGQPYILHCLRVMQAMATEEEMIVGVLHDLLEDCPEWLLLDLHDHGIPIAAINAIDALTKRRGESYDDYIGRVLKDRIARRVKMADLLDNMDLTRLPAPGLEDVKRAVKYREALKVLMAAEASGAVGNEFPLGYLSAEGAVIHPHKD